MRKFATKRMLCVLLVLAMVFSMLPLTAAAKSSGYKATAYDGIPTDRDIVIYSAAAASVFSYNVAGGSVGASNVTVDNGNIDVPEGAGAYRLTKNADGSYAITIGGKFVSVNSSEAISLEDAAQSSSELSSRWVIAQDADAKGYTLQSADVKYGKYPIFIEYYGGSFKAWTWNKAKTEDNTIYGYAFYTLQDGADTDGDGYIGVKPVSGKLPESGKKYVVFNDYGESVIGPMDAETATSMNAIPASVKNGKITVADGGLIFTITQDEDGYYIFENNGKYLSTTENYVNADGKNVNDEKLFMADEINDYTKWRLQEHTGGFGIYNKAGRYYTSEVCIEFFGAAFSGWTYKAGSNELFVFNFYEVEDTYNTGYVVNPAIEIEDGKPAIGADFSVKFAVSDLQELTSVKATYALDGAAAKELTVAETETAKSYTGTIAMDELVNAKKLTVNVETIDTLGVKATATKTFDILDEPLITGYEPAANAGTGEDKQPTIKVNFSNAGADATFKMLVNEQEVTPTVEGTTASYQFPTAQADGKVTVSFTLTRKDGKTASVEWAFFIGEQGLGHYRGQIHSHTSEYSDGAGTLEQAYEHAAKAKDIDFMIVTDHSNYFDTTTTASMDAIYASDHESLIKSSTVVDGKTLTKWEEAKKTAEDYTTSSFIAAYGYEMTWSGGPGHMNSFNTKGIVSRNNKTLNQKTNYAGLLTYYDLMCEANEKGATWTGKGQITSMFNHPGTTFGTFGNFTGYTPARDKIITMIEVGNGEGAVGGSSYWPSYEHYDNALAMGWHIAPANNQDNHKGNWGDSNTCRDVIVTDDFSEQGIYDAMAARHMYATEDQNLRIDYYLNVDGEEYMQGDIANPAQNPETVTFNCSISDPDGEALGKIEVIGAGGVTLWSTEVTGSSYNMKQTLNNTDAYYYIKVTEADGDIAVSAPVWVGESIAIMFTNMYNAAALSVVGDEDTITLSMTNSTENDFTVDAVEVKIDNKVVDNKLLMAGNEVVKGTVIAANTTNVDFTMAYTPASAGTHQIAVTMKGKISGMEKEFSFTKMLSVKSYVASELVSVGVDKGHDNYYISGNYAGSANNFITFCANHGVRCTYIEKGEFTYENLKQYKMIMLTVNYLRKDGKATEYTDDEIAALTKYVEEGGKVIICSKSDRENIYDNCAENTNKLLTAMGAHTRIVDGVIVDTDLAANEAYRVYFSGKENFNSQHPFTAGAYTSSNAFETTPAKDNQTGMQVYNGAPVEIIDDNGNRVTEDESNDVQVLIRGYQSTWGSHYDNYFTGSAFVPEYDVNDPLKVTVPKGEVNIITYEDTKAGGWIVTSGVTFFSDYDIKDDQNYANRYILRNILESLTGENQVTNTIRSLHGLPEATEEKMDFYTVEGIVTSNASGYDKDTAFFDCIYVQDETAGINVFPVSGSYKIGMKVRVHGSIKYYCGEIELNTAESDGGWVRIVSDDFTPLAPTKVTAKEAMSDENIGLLMQVEGTVTRLHSTAGVLDKIFIDDGSGVEACVFINGYITKDYPGLDGLKVGMKVSAIGIGSRDVDEESTDAAIFARLRVRNRAEIVITDYSVDPCAIFTDVDRSRWYHAGVDFAVTHGIMAGTGDGTTFAPNMELTRAMVVQVLYAFSGKPEVKEITNQFTDVSKDAWYAAAVTWAAENGITAGMGNGKFGVSVSISREQLATMLYAYATKIAKIEIGNLDDLSKYTDKAQAAAWAVNALSWAVGNGLISGYGSTTVLAPKAAATRAQFATIMMQFATKFNLVDTHVHEYKAVVTEPTCETAGYTTYTCECGDSYQADQVPALGHDMVLDETASKAATCIEAGYNHYKCSRCDKTQDENVAALGHNYVGGTCTRCGEADPDVKTIYTLTTSLKNGDKVVIYNPAYKKALGGEYGTSYYNPGVDVEAADGKLATNDTTIVWTVQVNADGTYGFAYNGQLIGMGKEYSSMPLGGVNNTWSLEDAGNSCFYIKNNGRSAYMEWFVEKNYFSGYGTIATGSEGMFAMQFYALDGGSVEPCTHAWNDGEVTTEPTCTAAGVKTYTCTKCGETKTETIAALGHVDADKNNLCDRCGESLAVSGTAYTLAEEIQEGDEVILYNANYKKAVPSIKKGSYYLDGVDLEAVDGTITTDNTAVVWTVGKDENGNFTFTQGDKMLSAYASDTHKNISLDPTKETGWSLEVCNEENHSFYVYNSTLESNYGHVYIEWYETYKEFTVYDTGASKLNEAVFGIQFYKKGGEAVCQHNWASEVLTAATCTENGVAKLTCTKCGETKTEPISALGHDLVSTDGVHFSCTRCSYTETRESTDGYTAVSAASEIANGKYVFVAQLGEKYYALTADGSTVRNAMYGTEVTVNKDGSLVKDSVVDAVVFTLAKGTTGYTFANGTNYIYHAGDGTQLKLSTPGTEFTFADAESGITARSTAAADRYITLRVNAGVPQFRCYKAQNLGGPTHTEYNGYLTIYKIG